MDKEWSAVELVLLAVISIHAGVQNHHSCVSVVPRVEVKDNVCIGPDTVLQVDNEPTGSDKRTCGPCNQATDGLHVKVPPVDNSAL